MHTRQASGIITLALTAGLLTACTMEQLLIGQRYTVNTPQAGACPALSWLFVVNAQRGIDGTLLRDGQSIANLSGTLNADDSFRMAIKDNAHNRTADATGQFTADVSTIAIHGEAAGTGCDGQIFKLRLRRYFSTQGGGGGGGGG